MNQISPIIRANLLNRFVDHWNGWTYELKPTCFWVREYELGEAKRKIPNVNLMWTMDKVIWAKNVWLLDENGLHERSPLDWRRFQILRGWVPPTLPYQESGPIHEIGMGCFAPLGNSEFLSEEIWGKRWGSGSVFKMDNAGNVLSRVSGWII